MRDSPVDRVEVAVSSSMARLRATQAQLNWFLWSTELSYGYVLLAERRGQFPDLDKPASEVLRDVQTEAWYPSNAGQIKYTARMGSMLDQVRKNTVHVYRAVLVSFLSAFEAYLDEIMSHA